MVRLAEEPPEKVTRVVSEIRQPLKVELTKGSKGNYRWSITVNAENPTELLDTLEFLEGELKRKYGARESENPAEEV